MGQAKPLFYFYKNRFHVLLIELYLFTYSNLMLMKAILNTEQVRPGDETMFMHAAFISEEEMMNFYLILNRFVNQSTYFMERPPLERLENLRLTLGKFQRFTNLFSTYQSMGIKPLIEGFGLYMMQQNISNRERKLAAEHVAYQMRFLLGVAKDIEQVSTLSHIIASHIQNVKYLLEKLGQKEESELD